MKKIILSLFLAGFAPLLEGALIAYDPFNQAVGPIGGTSSSGGGAIWPTVGQNYDNGTAGAIAAGSLAYGPLLTNGNQAQIDLVNNAQLFRQLGTTLGGNNTDLWVSFLIIATADSSGISLFQGTGGENNFMGAGGGSGQTIGLQNPNINTGIAKATTTHFYTLRLDMINDINTLYIDPNFSSLGNGLAPTGGTVFSAARADFTWDRIRLGDFNGATTLTRFDEFRIGNSWIDVSPIPEPGRAALLLLGTGGLMLRRRRD